MYAYIYPYITFWQFTEIVFWSFSRNVVFILLTLEKRVSLFCKHGIHTAAKLVWWRNIGGHLFLQCCAQRTRYGHQRLSAWHGNKLTRLALASPLRWRATHGRRRVGASCPRKCACLSRRGWKYGHSPSIGSWTDAWCRGGMGKWLYLGPWHLRSGPILSSLLIPRPHLYRHWLHYH